MEVGDLVCVVHHFEWMGRNPPCGIIVKKYTAWADPYGGDAVEESIQSMDGFQYDVAFGSHLIEGLHWGWEIAEVRENECR